MPYAWEPSRGTLLTGGSRAVVSVASQVITFSVSVPDSAAVGRLLTIFNSATNDGLYTIVAIAGLTVTVAESINNSGASGSGSCQGPGTERVTAQAISSFSDDHTVVASGAGFITNGVLVGDRVGVYGDAVNDGSYFVERVLTEDSLAVVGINNLLASGALTVSGASTGNLLVSEGYGTLTVSGEATSSWADVQTAFPFLVLDDRPAGLTSTLKVYSLPTLKTVEVKTEVGSGGAWVSQNEAVLPLRSSNAVITWDLSGVLGDRYEFQLGNAGTGDFGGDSGAYWFNGCYPSQGVNTNYKTLAYASVLHGNGAIWYPGQDSVIRHCLVAHDGGLFVEAGGVVTNLTYTDASYGFSATGAIESSDVAVVNTAGLSVVNVDNVIEDFRISDDAYTPVWWVFVPGVTVTARNPKEDYGTAELFNLFSTSSGIVDYTWQPRFVSRDSLGLEGDPISGLAVRVYEIEGASEAEIAGSPFTTNVSGQLGTDVYLKARYKYGFNSPVELSYRVLVQGRGYRTLNQVIELGRPFVGDVPVDFLLTDYEGEVST